MHLSPKLERSNQETSNQHALESASANEEEPFTSRKIAVEQASNWATKKRLFAVGKQAFAFISKLARAIVNNIKQRFSNPVLPSNAYRYLARQIVQDLIEVQGGKSLVFSSGTDMRTNSEVLLMLSHFLQDELSSSVLIIDATFKANGLTQLLNLDERQGIMDALSIKDPQPSIDSVIHPIKENISFIASGNSAEHPVPYISEKQARSIIDELTKKFDYVIFQQDQILMDTRYLPFAKSVDLVLLHLEERNTLISNFDEIKEVFADHQIYNTRYLLSER
ncbi:MAG: hypothetical protein COB20_09355 [SAR86 cluster bacterium]|uniref:Uncharacterized protein n=1 Tax=SAR86 cluster bacterium TaxID=2030880 RepID=A0A2A4X2V6_9GAMM|nr:MAG: hypothetical protein COB20_09355 [SAR86 cluster bacterium]